MANTGNLPRIKVVAEQIALIDEWSALPDAQMISQVAGMLTYINNATLTSDYATFAVTIRSRLATRRSALVTEMGTL